MSLRADGNGKIRFVVRSRLPCPLGKEDVSGSWISVVGHDVGTGKSDVLLRPVARSSTAEATAAPRRYVKDLTDVGLPFVVDTDVA